MTAQGLYYTELFDSVHLLATLLLLLLGCYVANCHKCVSRMKPIPRIGIAPGKFGFGLGRAKRDFARNGFRIIQRGYEMVRSSFTCKQRRVGSIHG